MSGARDRTDGPSGRILVGVAGWDYPDWYGIVYPASGRLDRLAYLARYVDAVEINSTFYRPIPPTVAQSWLRRTRSYEAFRFAAKVHRSLTHDREAHPRAAVERTLHGLEPLREAGRLGALLVQFPQSFHRTPENAAYLERLLESLEGWPVVVEVRHASWGAPEAESWFRERNVSWCAVDQPRAGRSTLRLRPRLTGPIGYVRLHGRNAANWFRQDAGRDARYDYLYTLAELEPIAAIVRRLAQRCGAVYAIQNNHFRGQAVVNALQMKHLLQGTRPSAPPTLLQAYPELAELTTPAQPRLFR